MKNMKRKYVALLIAVVTLLTVTVGGTVAYLVASTTPVVNKFTPAEVKTQIDEKFNGETKSKIVIENIGNVPVYIRVAVTGNWWKDGKIVESWTPNFTPGTGWTKDNGGYYYYNNVVTAGSETSNLLGSSITASTTDGKVLKVEVLSQAIQAEPTSAVHAAWGFVPGSN